MPSAPQTLEQMFLEHLTKFSASDRPGKIIQANVEKMFSEVVEEVFEAGGEMKARVREAIRGALPANVQDLFELARYNDLLATTLKAQWASSGVTADVLRRAKKVVDEVLSEDLVPEFVSLRELLTAFIEENQESALDAGWLTPHITIREVPTLMPGTKMVHICFDAEPEGNYVKTMADIGQPVTSRPEGEMANRISIQISGVDERGNEYGEAYSACLEGQPVGRNFMITQKWEKLVAALYFGGGKLVIDCDAGQFSYSALH